MGLPWFAADKVAKKELTINSEFSDKNVEKSFSGDISRKFLRNIDEVIVGMRVRHAEYGLGCIIKMEGDGCYEQVTILFDSIADKKKYPLHYSDLEYIGGENLSDEKSDSIPIVNQQTPRPIQTVTPTP